MASDANFTFSYVDNNTLASSGKHLRRTETFPKSSETVTNVNLVSRFYFSTVY